MPVNVLGPDIRGVLTRPARGARGPDNTWFKNCIGGDPLTGTAFEQDFFNDLLAQFRGILTGSGIGLATYNDNWMALAQKQLGLNYATASQATNAFTITQTISPTNWTDLINVPMWIKFPGAISGPATLAVTGTAGTKPLVSFGGSALEANDITAGMIAMCVYDGTSVRILAHVASAIRSIINPANLDVQVFNVSSTWVVPANCRFAFIECWGAGGGGGSGDGSNVGGLGGGGGCYGAGYYAVTPGASHTITIGIGGITRNVPGNAGAPGGTTSCGSLVSASFGSGGGAAGGVPGTGGTTATGAQIIIPGGGAFLPSFPTQTTGTTGGNGARGASGGQQGNSGQQPAGGAAGNQFNNAITGQKGGDGRVQITYAG